MAEHDRVLDKIRTQCGTEGARLIGELRVALKNGNVTANTDIQLRLNDTGVIEFYPRDGRDVDVNSVTALINQLSPNAWSLTPRQSLQGIVEGVLRPVVTCGGTNISTNTHSRQLPVGLPFFEAMSLKLTSELGPEGTGRRLGMKAFENMTVLDVGTRDGRYIKVFRNLGASEVFGIDPNEVELQKAVSAGILDNEHAIPKFLADLPREIKGSFDLATVFNFNIPITAREGFLADLNESLNSNGQAVLTFAETEILNATLPMLQRYFNVRTQQILGDDNDFPNKHLVIASKRIS